MQDDQSRAIAPMTAASMTASSRLAQRTLDSRTERLREVVVAADGTGDATSIAEALRIAPPDGRITVRQGVYEGAFSVDRVIEVIGDVAWRRGRGELFPEFPILRVSPEDPIHISATTAVMSRLHIVDSGLEEATTRTTWESRSKDCAVSIPMHVR